MARGIDRIQIANAILDTLVLHVPCYSSNRALSTSYVTILVRDKVPRAANVRGTLEQLYLAGVVSRFGRGKYRWRMNKETWNKDNPFHVEEKDNTPIPHSSQESHSNNGDIQELLDAAKEELRKAIENQREAKNEVREVLTKAGNLESELTLTKELLEEEKKKGHSKVKVIEVKNLTTKEVLKMEGTPHVKLEPVLKRLAARLNVLLVGPAGSGKSYLAEQAAAGLDMDFAFISCSAGLSEGHLLGRFLPIGDEGEYIPSPFVTLYEGGGLFLFDEVDAADANTLLILNTALSGTQMAVPNRVHKPVAKKHKDFVCIAAANTFGNGADRQYVGRNQLDEAFLDRFRIGQITVDYDTALETRLCPDDDLRRRLWRYRENITRARLRRVVSSRFLQQAYIARTAGIPDSEIDEALFSGWKEDERTKARGISED